MRHKHLRQILGSALLVVAALAMTVAPAFAADSWTSDADSIDATLDVGYLPDGSAFAGTVSTHSQFVIVSGQFKIDNSIVAIVPQPGFSSVVRKSGGLDSAIEVAFSNGRCEATFKFLVKPGLTRVDSGVLRCK